MEVIGREEYAELQLDAKVELIRSLIPLGLMHVQDLLMQELQALAGAATRGRTRSSAVVGMAGIPAASGLVVNAFRFACRAFGAPQAARSPCGRTRR